MITTEGVDSVALRLALLVLVMLISLEWSIRHRGGGGGGRGGKDVTDARMMGGILNRDVTQVTYALLLCRYIAQVY